MGSGRDIEKEFGVPIPGKIVDPSRWTKTALKKLPDEGPLDVPLLFGRTAPLVVDLGCGNGRFVLGSALRRPDHDHLAIDILPMVLRYATRRANQRGLSNIRFAACDAETLVRKYLRQDSVQEVHCYHPQPYHDPAKAERRLIQPEFLSAVHRVLEAGGRFYLQTDNRPYWKYMSEVLPGFFDFHVQQRPWPEDPRGRTRREIYALKHGLKVYRGWGEKKELSEEALAELVQTLPRPTFRTRHEGGRDE